MEKEMENAGNEEMDTTEVSTAVKFAEQVMAMAEQVQSGDMTVEDFIAQVTEEMKAMQDAPVDMASPMGGLGLGGGEFNLPEPE